MKKNRLVLEFIRYSAVGAAAFILDFMLLYICQSLVFHRFAGGLYISTAIGFASGVILNYILSIKYVFESAVKENKGKSIGAFTVFAIIGVAGLALTELGMYISVDIIKLHYLAAKLFVTAAVLIWNYGMRKLLIFR